MVKLTLEGFEPTDAEINKANETIKAANAAAKRSKLASMVQFIKGDKTASEEDKKRILDSRGDTRQDYLRRYVAYTIAKTTGRLKTEVTHESEDASKKGIYLWNMFQVAREVG